MLSWFVKIWIFFTAMDYVNFLLRMNSQFFKALVLDLMFVNDFIFIDKLHDLF